MTLILATGAGINLIPSTGVGIAPTVSLIPNSTQPHYIDYRSIADIDALGAYPLEPNATGTSSAVSLGQGIFLTAAHNLLMDNLTSSGPFDVDIAEGLLIEPVTQPGLLNDFDNFGEYKPNIPNTFNNDLAYIDTGVTDSVDNPLIIFSDPNEATGGLFTAGYPGDVDPSTPGLQGGGEVAYYSTGHLSVGQHIGFVNGLTAWQVDPGLTTVDGQSGSGVWLQYDLNKDGGIGAGETYLAGIVSGTNQSTGRTVVEPIGDAYQNLATYLQAEAQILPDLTLIPRFSADDFATHTLIADQNQNITNTVNGTWFNENIHGSDFADILNGGAGNDTIYGGDGLDTIDGGNGYDIFREAIDDGFNDSLSNIEKIEAPQSGTYSLIDIFLKFFPLLPILPPPPFDVITTPVADETTSPHGPEALSVAVDDGRASLEVDEFGELSVSKIEAGTDDEVVLAISDFNWGDGDIHLDTGREDLSIVGTDGDDIYNGQNYAELIIAEDGDDIVSGGGGDDEISGGAGDDRLRGNNGADELYGDRGNDEIHGSGGDDKVWGGAGNDLLFGEGGNDQISGGDGWDGFVDLSGTNIIHGGSGGFDIILTAQLHTVDIFKNADGATVLETEAYTNITTSVEVVYSLQDLVGGFIGYAFNDGDRGDTGNDILISEGRARLAGGAGGDYLSSIGTTRAETTLNGNGGDDILKGGDNVDFLNGASGDDIIDGGGGDDIMSGSWGADTFVFREDFGNDTIKDYDASLDVLQFASNLAFNSATVSGDDVILDFGVDGELTLQDYADDYAAADVPDLLFA